MSDRDILIEAENLGKKFCRSLKRSLWYGVQDIARDLSPFKVTGHESRVTSHGERVTKHEAPSTDRQAQGTKNQEPGLRPDEFWALQDVSFQLRRGECLGLIGHNGAGKSTLLKILNGLIRPDTGRLTMRGRVGALIELSAGFNPILTGRENIYNRGALLGFSRNEIDRKFDAIVDFAEIGDFLDMPVRNYSSGMAVRLGFAVTAQMQPDIIIIDEVLAVGDLGFRFKCLNRISELLKGSAVIFVSHSMPQVMRIATQIMVLAGGKIEFSGFNLGEGVHQYFSQFSETDIQVNGTGEVALKSLRLTASEGTCKLGERISLENEGSIAFDFELQAKEKAVTKAVVQILFWNHEMIPVLDVADHSSHGFLIDLDNDSGTAHVRLQIPALPLNSGKFYVSVIVTAPNLERIYCQVDHAAKLTITSGSPASGAGCVTIGDWRQSS